MLLGEKEGLMCEVSLGMEEVGFTEFRRKIRAAEVFSAAMQRLLSDIHFNGRLMGDGPPATNKLSPAGVAVSPE